MSRMIDLCALRCDDCGDWVQTPDVSTSAGRRWLHQYKDWVTKIENGKKIDLCEDCAKKRKDVK